MLTLKVSHLKKKFEKREILSDVSFQVEDGEFIGITGANGSGKTVLLNIILDILQPDDGKIIFWENQKISQKIKKEIGVLNCNSKLINYLSPLENLEFVCQVFGVKNYQSKINRFFKLLKMDVFLSDKKTPMEKLSNGQNIKINFIKSIITNPRLILLDEPTSYLDIRSKDKVIKLLADIKKEHGCSCLVVSHSTQLLEICDRVLTLKNGKLS